MFRSALLILSGNSFASILSLLRTLIVARLISVEDYGIAATFAISVAIVEMMTMLGLQQMIVQDRDGNDPRLQAALQGFQLLRACLSSLVLFLLAHPLALFLGIPEVTWAYQLMALVPLLSGLQHFDVHRFKRRMRYLPAIVTRTVPALLSLLLVWPFYQLFGDYRVMLYSVLASNLLGITVSHLVAERRYQISLDRAIIRRCLRFGWPLLINGMLMFAIFHGEKLIVGRELGIEVLAIFAMGFTLTLTPTLIVAGSMQSFFLPQLSAAKDEPGRFAHLAMAAMQASLLNGLLLVVGMMLVGELLVELLLGEKYAALVPILLWLAMLNGARVLKSGNSQVALSQAKTENAMIANGFRVITLPVSWYIAATTGDLLLVIWTATAGEVAAYAISITLIRMRLGISLRRMLLPISLTLTCLALASAHWISATAQAGEVDHGQWSMAAVATAFVLAVVSMTDLRKYVARRVVTKYAE